MRRPLPTWVRVRGILVTMPCACTAVRACTECRGQAGVLGQVWAERVARLYPEHRSRAEWPTDERALAIARGKVGRLSRPEHVEVMALACVEGAVEWWARRGPGYR